MDVIVGGTIIGSIQEKCLCNCHIAYGVHDAAGNLLYTLDRCACYWCVRLYLYVCFPVHRCLCVLVNVCKSDLKC